ncbi:MAG: DsbA family protein [Alphaproteobacteria bacterium]|jgi:2-hydroxychromene-2-carboxylate isomerase/predicted thioesterase|nr:hypothetical protein [Rhodospirillaceae bacterium]MBT6508847.1 hypothetical protein [Rhodospirillaceae bacterium]MBT7615532.1 hypothetical protein [Rhodospirillaceae bacterium]MBT7648111.1 hypothetical protein [Rhodospirillaceae bacterium]MDG2481239.1 DsbA family protein [Alphaproteobacteria bacterium]
MRTVPPGITIARSFQPSSADTAAAVGNVGVEVVATVTMILWVEATCGPLITPYFDEGEASVGFRVAVDHTGPAFADRPVDVHAEVTAVEGRKVSFAVGLEQDGKTVMVGEHVRAIVDLTRFLDGQARAAEKPARPPITFFFDVHSPWSYLAANRIGHMARRHHAKILWRPIHLANLMETIDGLRPMEQSAARVAWYEQDCVDRFSELGLAYDPHPDYPLRPSRALRAIAYAAEQGCVDAFVQTVMRGYWAEHADISDLEVLQAMADAVGLRPRAIAEIVDDAAYKQVVTDNTGDAIDQGVFGVPSFLFNGKLYFGNDHMEMLDRALGSWTA